jgi:hypothetical protein
MVFVEIAGDDDDDDDSGSDDIRPEGTVEPRKQLKEEEEVN